MQGNGSYKWDLERLFLRPKTDLVARIDSLQCIEVLQMHHQLEEAGYEIMVEIVFGKDLCNSHDIVLRSSDGLPDYQLAR